MKENAKVQGKKLWITLFLNGLVLYFSRYPLVLDSIYRTTFPWYYLFPMLIAFAWGKHCALLSFAGGFLFLPFLEHPEYGLANVSYCFLHFLLLWICAYLGERECKDYEYYLLFSLFAVFYYIFIDLARRLILDTGIVYVNLVRFASPMISRICAITTVMGIMGLAAMVRVVVKLPPIRKMLALKPLPYAQKNTYTFFAVIMVMAAFFLVDGLFESFYFQSRGMHTFWIYSSFGDMAKFPLVFLLIFAIGDALISITMITLKSHDKLIRSEERYRVIFQNMTDAYFEVDREGKILNVNPAAESMGFLAQQLKDKKIAELVDDKIKAKELIETLFREQHIENIEMQTVLPSQVDSNLLISGVVVNIEHHDVATLIVRDITEYKKNEEQRWELSAILNAIFESNKDFIWTVDAKSFSISSFNQAFGRYVQKGFGKEIKNGCRMTDIFPKDDGNQFIRYYRQVLEQGDLSAEYITPDGMILDMNFYPVKLDGQITSIVVFSKDMTARKRAEKKIEELNAGLEQTVADRTQSLKKAYQDLESFSFTMIHELKTPIREIHAYLEVIQEDNFSILIEQSREDIASAQRVCLNTLDMIEKMMLYTKAGFMMLDIEKIEMEGLVKDCFEEICQANANVHMHLTMTALPYLYVDKFLLHVAIANVLSNSMKFSREKEVIELEVGCSETKEYFIYYFKDNGMGFSMKKGKDLFELFQRAHNSGEYEGNGIGLALVNRIVERHGGAVDIQGKAGEGCTVYFLFPKALQIVEKIGKME